jgi:uncharacterized caspase-like protein
MGGTNRIEVSARDKRGLESLRALRAIEGPTSPPGGDVHVVAFGISKYEDARLDLDYADKDARDLAAIVQAEAGPGRRVFTHVFTNEQATAAAIRGAKSLFANVGVDDTVVLFIAGHGVFASDASAEYYFLTHDVDLNHLTETAVTFEVVEDLLSGIAARKKLFLMDACQSGDRDEDVDTGVLADARARGFKARGLVLDAQQDRPKPRSYLALRERYIYNDLQRRTGAIVFSSSTGSEFSYEMSDLENGVFTHAIVRALRGDGDANGDGRVSTEELRTFVSGDVATRTSGMQHPVVDRDNLDMVFGFPVTR